MKNKTIHNPAIIASVLLLLMFACNPGKALWKKDKQAFEASKVLSQFKSVSDMNDMFFEIRENNFFYTYRRLFDSVKNTEFKGRYSLVGDTMMLKFYQHGGEDILGHKAMIVNNGNELIFFDSTPGTRRKWLLF